MESNKNILIIATCTCRQTYFKVLPQRRDTSTVIATGHIDCHCYGTHRLPLLRDTSTAIATGDIEDTRNILQAINIYSYNREIFLKSLFKFHFCKIMAEISSNRGVTTYTDQHSNTTAPSEKVKVLEDVISTQAGVYIFIVSAATSLGLGVFGTITNTISIMVFIRQGLKDSVTISLFGLALADLWSLLTIILIAVLYGLSYLSPNPSVDYISVSAVFGGWPHALFLRISTWITVVICVERFLCVFIPLKVKLIFTAKRAGFVNIFVFISMTCCYAQIYASHGLHWVFAPTYNRSRLVMWITEDRVEREAISGLMNGIIFPSIAIIIITVSTAVMVRSLQTSMSFRKATTNAATSKKVEVAQHVQSTLTTDKNKKQSRPSSQKRVVKMVSSIAIVFILCSIPEMVLTYVSRLFVLELNLFKRYHNMYNLIYAIDYQLQNVNAGVNIFIYYSMSSKFKENFDQMFLSSATKKK
ncbi:unnamed protein product [Lymnaea stagnalis]|uniref:G-protein coupled receptors family 1 profile domain-containing protein n=1 Tax=Lymnaea stagnalis TaxID=6523 RepID=A0AAV2HZ46_LYMST